LLRGSLDTARVVKIEMGEHDMAHIRSGEPELLELAQGGIGFSQPDTVGKPEEPAEPPRLRDVAQSEPGIDQDEPDFGLDQQTMADDLGGPEDRS
jgi:hypothetical protein